MRKKTHIFLSRYLILNMGNEGMTRYRKSFYLGSILPDCVPTFITRRHTFEETFPIVKKEMEKLLEYYLSDTEIDRYFCRKLGMITHYIADYFTFPHNSTFTGTMKEHCHYENILKHEMKEYVSEHFFERKWINEIELSSLEALLCCISDIHNDYLSQGNDVSKDIDYIIKVNTLVVDSIVKNLRNQWSQDDVLCETSV